MEKRYVAIVAHPEGLEYYVLTKEQWDAVSDGTDLCKQIYNTVQVEQSFASPQALFDYIRDHQYIIAGAKDGPGY